MKHLLLLSSLFLAILADAQPLGKKVVLPLVNWTMTLPPGFATFPAPWQSLNSDPDWRGIPNEKTSKASRRLFSGDWTVGFYRMDDSFSE